MTWNKNTEPKTTGWYLCTIQLSKRYVMPIYRCEYPKGNYYWDCGSDTKIVACVKFPEPYKGE